MFASNCFFLLRHSLPHTGTATLAHVLVREQGSSANLRDFISLTHLHPISHVTECERRLCVEFERGRSREHPREKVVQNAGEKTSRAVAAWNSRGTSERPSRRFACSGAGG